MKRERGPMAWSSLRWVLAALVVAALAGVVVVFASSGDDDEPSKPPGALAAALSYLPGSTGLVAALPTGDVASVLALEQLAGRERDRRALRAQLGSALERSGIEARALRTQVGNPLVLGFGATDRPLAAIQVRDPQALRRTAEARIDAGKAERIDAEDDVFAWRGRGDERSFAAIVDHELIVAGSRADLDRALEAGESSDSIAFDERFVAELRRLDSGTLMRSVGDAQRLLARDPLQAAALRRIRWVRALGLITGAARIEGGEVRLEFELRTDRIPLAERELPLAPGRRSPRLHDPGAPAAVAVREPDRLARFLERSVAATDPDSSSRYEAAIAQLRSLFGVDVHADLFRKLRSLSVAFSSPVALRFVAPIRAGEAPAVTASLRRAAPAIDFALPDYLPGARLVPRGRPASVWELRRGNLVVARYAVEDGALVGSIGLAGLPAATAGRRVSGVNGSLVAVGDLRLLGRALGLVLNLPAQALEPVLGLGDVVIGVRSSTEALNGRGRLDLGR